jgi:hypothetical protein
VELQQHLAEFDAESIKLFTISYDPLEVLSGFASDHGIDFPMLADTDSEVIKKFGILNTLAKPKEDEYYGIPYPGTYLVERDGRVVGKFFNREYQVRETSATMLSSGFDIQVDAESTVSDRAGTEAVGISAVLNATDLHPRQQADLYVTLEIERGLHVYGPEVPEGYIPTSVSITAPEGVIIRDARYPETVPFRIDGLPEEFQVFDVDTRIVVPIESRIREPGTAALEIEVRYQACNDRECFTPRTDRLHVEFQTGPMVPGRPRE